ncbi:MAG: GAF domain-containing protein [Anaerolineales bacterium]|nr:GAF domain-containing protein [Anaerolineales bacterium]
MVTKKNTKKSLRDTPTTPLDLLYQISKEVATTLDLSTVLERVLSLSIKTIGAIRGSIIILDENENPVASAIIVQDQVISHTNEQLRSTLDEGLAGWVVKNRDAVIIPNTSNDERWLRRPDDEESATGAKSAIAVPIMARNDLVGVITLVHPEPNHLQEKRIALIHAIADQAGIAVLNAQLYEESQRQARVMTALANSASALSSTLRLENVLQNILEEIRNALQVEAVTLSLIDRNEGYLVYKAAIHDKLDLQSSLIGKRIKIGQGFSGFVAQSGQGEIVNNPSADKRLRQTNQLYPEISPYAIVAAPIFLLGKVLGVLEAINPYSGYFESDSLLVLSGIGSLAGSSIQNAQLYEDLQVAHSRYHDLFENSADPIIITDLMGNIIETNNRTLKTCNYSPEELNIMGISEIHDINWDIVGKNFSKLIEDTSSSYESILATKDEDDIPIQVNVHQIQIADQCRLQWILRDISERKNLDQLREDLTSMIFHDLRSPLSNVISSLDVIQASLPDGYDPEINSLFEIANRSTVRIQRLTKSLLDINRLESGQPITNKELLNPEELINYAKQALISQANAKKQKVNIDLGPNIPQINADRDMIERVLINIFQNAIKFTPTNGMIEFGAKVDDNDTRFWVLDSGSGVDPDYIGRIFDKFTRMHPDERIKGLGLGLAFCRLAVEGHGGRIWVENLPKGGAMFSFTIPIAN